MKKFIKILLITIVVLFLLVCVAGYIILKHVDLNQYKGIIEEKATAATGRELKIGNIQINPSFSPVIEVKDVTLANASWAKDDKMATIGSIEVSVSLLPLWYGNYVINKFVIHNAVVNIEESAEYGANWVFENVVENTPSAQEEKTSYKFSLVKEAYAAEGETSDTGDDIGAVLSKVVVEEVALQNVKINYTDKTAKTQTYDIQGLTLDKTHDDNLDFTFDINSGLYRGKGTLGGLNLLKSDKGYPVKADVDIMGIGVVTDMTLFDIFGNLRFDGSVKAKGFFGKNSTYKESADVYLKGDLAKIDAVINRIEIASNVVTGKVGIKLDEKVPAITADLKSDRIDIASFENKKQSAWNISLIKEAQATKIVPADNIPYEVLSLINADADIAVAKIVNQNSVLIEDLKVNAKINNGSAILKILNGILANGNIKATAVLNPSFLNFDAEMSKVNLLTLLKALDAQSESFNFISGSDTDLYVNLTGRGSTYAAIVENLNGRIALVIDKSKLHLGNIGLVKGNIFSQLFNTLNLTKGNDDLNVACAVVRTDVVDGLAEFPNGIVINADKFTVVANGDINLKDDKINFGVKPFGGKLTDTNIAKALSSLVKLTGTLQKTKVGVDTANVVKNVVGATMTGPVYLGAQMVMENDNSPCYTALKDTIYESRFPKSDNIAKATTQDVGKVLDDSVGMVKDTAKGLLNMFSGKGKDAK